MAIFKTLAKLKNFELSNGKTVDLIGLIHVGVPTGWISPTHAPEIGTVAYVDAMGSLRRGVVVKTTKTKVHVAITTQGAVNAAAAFEAHVGVGRGSQAIRVQIAIADINHVRVAPPAEPVKATAPDTSSLLAENPVEADHTEELTLDSQAGKVDNMNEMTKDALGAIEMLEAPTDGEVAAIRETTGSAVVKLLERVHERIRQNHPEVPAMVIVTGAGTAPGAGSKWGHFRPQGWTTADKTDIHEMFMAGETLAKGAKQVLQTMLHECAHALAEVRKVQDTSRQGRWHNAKFLEMAVEMGLEHRAAKADKSIGYSQVTLTEKTLAEYADLLEELDKEIHLRVRLPFWLGGDAGEQGGEGMGKKPTEGGSSTSNNLKLTCLCEEPNIIRASKKVAEKNVITCDDCDEHFKDRG